MLKRNGLLLNGEYQIVKGMTIYPEKVMNGKNFCSRRLNIYPCTKAIHHYDATWVNEEQRQGWKRFEKEMYAYE